MKQIITLLLFLLSLSTSTSATEFKNRFSLGNFGYSNLHGTMYALEYLRVLGQKHALFFRTNQVTDSSQEDYLVGYRYYTAENAWGDSWFLEGGYKWGRDVDYDVWYETFPSVVKHESMEVERQQFVNVVLGHQWVYFNRMHLDFGIGYKYNLKESTDSDTSGVLTIGILF